MWITESISCISREYDRHSALFDIHSNILFHGSLPTLAVQYAIITNFASFAKNYPFAEGNELALPYQCPFSYTQVASERNIG